MTVEKCPKLDDDMLVSWSGKGFGACTTVGLLRMTLKHAWPNKSADEIEMELWTKVVPEGQS